MQIKICHRPLSPLLTNKLTSGLVVPGPDSSSTRYNIMELQFQLFLALIHLKYFLQNYRNLGLIVALSKYVINPCLSSYIWSSSARTCFCSMPSSHSLRSSSLLQWRSSLHERRSVLTSLVLSRAFLMRPEMLLYAWMVLVRVS